MTEIKLVRDLMTVGVPTCKTTTPLVDIARYLIENQVEEMVKSYSKENVKLLAAENIMREGVPELPADITIALAAEMMKDKGIRVAYMLHNSAGIIYPAAMISYRHIVRHLAALDDSELKDLGLAAERKSPIEKFIERRDEARKKAGLT
jgi:CBS domain-containing protein